MMGSSYDDWTVRELKEALEERGLPVSGKKRVLIERLEISSGGKNYLKEGVLNAGDADLVEQIKAKYRAPDYRQPKDGGRNPEYTKISNGIIVLGLLAVAAVYFLIIGGNKQGDGFILPCCTTSLLFVILSSYISKEVKKTDIVHTDEVPGTTVLQAAGVFGLIISAYVAVTEGPDEWLGFYCCSSFILLGIPFIALGISDSKEALQKLNRKKALRNKLTQEHYIAWEDAQKHEENNQFDAAARIWSELGEEGEVERVTGLKTEYLCVILKRKIKDLTELGADCTQLEEQLAMIETALAESATSKSSIGTERGE